jgi:hypothetical protein
MIQYPFLGVGQAQKYIFSLKGFTGGTVHPFMLRISRMAAAHF